VFGRNVRALRAGPAPLTLEALGRSHLLPCASMRWLLSLLLIPLLSQCGPGAAAEPLAQASAVDTTYGYLIIQKEAAQWWGFAPGDTLSERPLEVVPSLVQQAAYKAGAEYLRWEKPPCHRYFQGEANYVALVDLDCPYGGWNDGRVLMGITPSGEHLSPPWTLVGWRVVERICPGDRDRSGREARGKWQSERCTFSPAPEQEPELEPIGPKSPA
jgi:hypothetical protein